MRGLFVASRVALALILFVSASANLVRAQTEKKTVDKFMLVESSNLTVVGVGKVSAVPNLADINIGVSTQAPTAKESLAKNSELMNTLHKVLKERGVAAKDIETTHIYINPVYNQPNPRMPREQEFVTKVVAYTVVNTVSVTVREIGKVGELLDVLVEAGANQMNGITFRVENTDLLLDSARKKAIADAKRKAELIAGEAGVVLGRPTSITENATESPRPFNVGARFGATMMAAAAPAPVAPGEQELSVSIQVSYQILEPKS